MEFNFSGYKNKRVFVLEDQEIRQDRFTKYFTNLVMTAVVSEAVAYLTQEPWDIIFLDHDLDDGLSDETGNGLDVIRALRGSINEDTLIVVHSMNPVGAGNMIKEHPFNVVHVPYHILQGALK